MASVLSRIQIIMEANTARYNNEMRRARENSSTTFGEIGKSASKSALVVGAALAGMGAISIKTAMSFETSMAEIDKTVEFTSSNGLANMRKELQALTTQIPQTFQELAAVTATGGQLGIAEKDLVHFTEVMAKMGVAFDIPAQQAADSMAKIANVFQIPIENIDRLGDAINTLSNNTPATAAQLIDSLQRVGGVAKVFGLSEDATLGLTGALIAMGKPAEVASTAVNSLLTSFSTLDNATKSQLIGFEQLGLNIDDFSQLVATDGKQAIITYLEAINQLEQSKRIGTNALIIGKEFGDDITMLAGSVGVLENNWAMLGETVNTTKDYFGSMDVEFEKISATSANKMVLFKNNIDGVVASVGEAFIPALNELLLNMTPMVATIGTWVAANPELIQQITLIGGSLLGTIVGLKLAVDGFTAAKATIDGLKLAFGAAKAGFAILAGGIGLPLLAIAALIAAGVLLYQNWDLVKEKASQLNEWVKEKFGSLPEPLQQAGRDIAEIFKFIWNTGKEYLTLMSELYSGTFESFATIATGAFQIVWSIIKVSFSGIVNTVSSALQIVAAVFSAGFALVKNTVTTVLGVIKAVISGDFKAIPGIIGNGLKTAASIVGNMMTGILNIIKEAGKKLYSIGRDFIKGFYNGIKSMASGVASAASTMVGNAVAAVKKRQDSASPSKVTTKLGGDFAKGMADGINKGAKAVKTEAQKMAEGAIEAVKTGVASLQREIALFGNDSALAALDFDIAAGKYKGANTDEFRNLTQRLELTKELASANDSVQSSIDAMIKKRVLFNNSSEVASLEYDILNTDRFKNASGERVQQLLDETRAVEGLANQLKATNAIKERFAQLEAAQKSAENAFDGLEINGPQTEAEKLQLAYQNKMAIVDRFEQMHTDKTAQAAAARVKLTEQFNDSSRQLERQRLASNLGGITALFGMALGETSKGYKGMFLIQKAFDFASAQSASFTAIAKAWSSAPFPANLPAVGMTTLQTGIIPAAIQALNPKGFMAGGYTGNYATNQPVGPVHGKEFVAHADATRKYRPELEAMNNGTYDRQSSAPNVNVNVTVSMDGNSSVESNSAYGKQIGQVIAAAAVSEVRKMMRPNGELDRQYAKR
ncbi:phage tail tape measure [Psychrobacter phage Psymv2]|uniref:tail length tape measure protein n=1 Tax=Psychrobacter phage Psymv2 TaxID=1071177 RepID=UPI00022A3805|nr:tail length tape measure protein [Psychrobacter phage Psymv2]AEO01019.1 phage tail tape measure [Psychrobacter phage Psymv2]